MKLYDVLLANTDIQNFCAGEKYYYLKMLKQLVNLISDWDIYEYQVEFQGEYTIISVTDKGFENDVYTITNKPERILIQGRKKLDYISMDRYMHNDEYNFITESTIKLEDNLHLFTNVRTNEDSVKIIIESEDRNKRIKSRKAIILPNNSVKIIDKDDDTEYEDSLNSFLYNIAKEDKKIKVLK